MSRPALLRLSRLIRKELRQLFRDPRTKRIIFAAPIVQLLAFGYAVSTDVQNVSTFVSDHDRSFESRLLLSTLDASGYFRIVGGSPSAAGLRRALDRGDARVAVVIPAGFAESLAAGRPVAVQVLVDGTNSNTATVAQGYAVRLIGAFGRRRVEEGRATALSASAPDAGVRPSGGAPGGVDLRARAWFNPGLESRAYNVPGVVGLIVLLMSILLTALGVVRERELGTLDQLLVSPLSPAELMLGKTLPVTLVALLQLALVMTVALLWFRVPFRGSFFLLLVAALVFILAGLSLGLLVSTISKTQQEAFLGMILILFPIVILSGFLYPVDTMPWFFERLSLLNPLRHFLEIVRAVFLKGAGPAALWPQLAVLVGMAVLGLGYATRRFRRMIG